MAKVYEILLIQPGDWVGKKIALNHYPKLSELQGYVGGLIELVQCGCGGKNRDMLVNEEGLYKCPQYNAMASSLSGQDLVGPALVLLNFKLR